MNNNSMDETLEFDVGPVYKWLIPVLWLTLFVAFVGNLLILISSRWLSNEITPHLRLCISLAAADAWAACLLIIGLLFNSYLPMVYNYRYGSWFPCYMLTFEMVRVGSMLTSDFHLFALAFNQFYSIWAPFKYRVTMTKARTRLIIIMLWLFPLSCLFLYCIIAPGQGYLHEGCPKDFYFQFEFRFTIFLLFTLPLLATVIIYSLILNVVFNDTREESSTIPLRRSFKRGAEEENSSKRSRKRAVVTTLLIVMTFCFSWLPCVLYFTLVCENCALEFTTTVQDVSPFIHLSMSVFVKCLVIIKLTINPLIYTLRMTSVREALQLMVDTRCGRVRMRKNFPNSLQQMTYRSVYSYIKNVRGSHKSLDTGSCTSVL